MVRDPVLLAGRALGQTFLREERSDKYVSIPPACVITDETGATWTFGKDYDEVGRHYEFSVPRNDCRRLGTASQFK